MERLNAEVAKALAEPGLAQRFAQMGVYLQTSTSAAFGDWVRKEIPKWGEVVRRATSSRRQRPRLLGSLWNR